MIKNVAYANHTFPNKLSYLTKSYISHGIYNPIEMIKRDKLLDKKGGKYHNNNNNKMTIALRVAAATAVLFRCPGSISFTLERTNAEQQLTELISRVSVWKKCPSGWKYFPNKVYFTIPKKLRIGFWPRIMVMDKCC